MKHQPKKGPSQKAASRRRIAAARACGDFPDRGRRGQRAKGEIVTVAEVRLSPDLKHAVVFASALSGKNSDIVAEALNRHHRFLRGELARRVELKYVPNLVFKGDHLLDEAGRIEDLLRSPEVARDLK